jgi:hypothetical protein
VPFGVCWSVTALSALGLRQPALGLGHGGSLPIGPPTAGQAVPNAPGTGAKLRGRLARAVAAQSDPFAARRPR